MNLQKTIKDDLTEAVKSRDKKLINFLKVVTTEITNVASKLPNNPDKLLSDDLTLAEIRKMSQNAKVCAEELRNRSQDDSESVYEVATLSKYLPTMFDEPKIREIVEKIISDNNFSSMKNMGGVMGKIRQLEDASKIDNKTASTIVKELLS